MKKILLIICLAFVSASTISAQSDDVLCVDINTINPEGYDVFSSFPGFDPDQLELIGEPNNCYFVAEGRLYIVDNTACCNMTFIIRFRFSESGPIFDLELQIKCPEPKPNCTTINLMETDTATGLKPVIYSCDQSPITYIVDEAPGQTITWDAGIATVTQGPDNQAVVVWPDAGSYSLTVTVGGVSSVYCIDVLDSPEADFTIAGGGSGCLNTSIGFMSTGLGGNEFFWDFGDGQYGSGATTTNTYSTPGIYDVTLVVVQDNFDAQGRPLCCCTDTITMPVTISPLEGPEILWVSTLCEGDTTKYWTTAEDCVYTWSAADADGMNVLPPGTVTTNDTLCVVWGDGPFGTVSLAVSGCSNGPFCTDPTTVFIPIIESVTEISGADTVCTFSSNFYDVQKWPTTTYNWSIDPASAGYILSGQGSNAVEIQWNVGPQYATINVEYGSEFLGGIFGHTPEDCQGMGSFDVHILPEFEIKQPLDSKFCLNEDFTLEAGDVNFTNINPVNGWTWEIRPPSGSSITSNGHMSPYTTSLAVAGYYTIVSYPDFPNPYCNDTAYMTIEIVDVPLPDSITGEKIICPGSTHTYFGHTSTPGTQLEWMVTDGTITSSPTGNPVTVQWDPTGSYTISVRQVQTSAPECASDYLTCPIEIKSITPITSIAGSNGCTNEIFSYTASPLPTDPEVTYSWSILPVESGSVVAGDNSVTCDIQWNNDPGTVMVIFSQTLCGVTTDHSETFMLNQAAPVNVSQDIDFCAGVGGVTLTGSTVAPPATYDWDVPTGPNQSGQSIIINEGGNYVVTVTESNGCTAVTNYLVNEVDGPNTNLSSPDLLNLCTVNMGQTVSLTALGGSWTIIEWWKQTNAGPFVLAPMPVDPLEYIHTNSGVVGTCTYYYVAQNSAGCITNSNTKTVSQTICTGGGVGTGCTPENHTADFTYTPSLNCNDVTFSPNISANVTITGWNFDDPINISPTGPGPMFTYSYAGYYLAYMYYSVPDQNGGPDCDLSDTTSVCVPMVADFSITDLGCGNYTFADASSYVAGMAPTTYSWTYGDGNTGSGSIVSHDYLLATGMLNVTLTITNPAGCQSIVTKVVDLAPPVIVDIVVEPSDTCVTKPFVFSNLDDTGIISWDWDFGDLTGNGSSNPEHAYLTDGTFMVTLTVTNENGCTGSDVAMVTVHPAPAEGPITYAPDLFLCVGESLTLNAPTGDTYLWSNGNTMASISVMTAGYFGVTVTDLNGCMFVPDSVEVILYPEIDATIDGNPIICDEGCTTLFAGNVAGYVYTWTDQVGNPLTPNNPANSVDVCHGTGITNVILTIIDDNGCQADNDINIDYYTSPDVNITVSDPTLCAGTPNTLTANTSYPNPVTYRWSTGATTTSITVGLEGSYFVTITDPATGCSNSDFVIINPLPDLCIVPAGCYKACDPDTLCAPAGLTEYEWYFEGTLEPAYSGMECIIVSESGTYNFEGTNEYGCTDISEPLVLILVPCCRPGDTEITAVADADLSCCYNFSYTLSQDIFYSLDLYSADAGLGIDIGSVDPSLSITSSIPALNSFENATAGAPLPLGPIVDFITICLEDVTLNPAIVLADWRGEDGTVLCTDTLTLICEVEPDCIYILEDSIYCGPNGNLLYDLTICNPSNGEFAIGYIDFVEFAPASAMFVPSAIDITGMPLAPGECRDFTISITGSGIANDSLKFKLIGHENNPMEDPGTLCCSLDGLHCAFIPGCSPCDMVFISSIDASDIGDCCYDVTINNYLDANNFDGLQLCVITADATIDLVNPLGSPWDITGLTGTNAILDYSDGAINHIPLGNTALPTICIAESQTPFVEIEIKWMKGTSVACRDTITILCEGDCGYMANAALVCGDDGTWIFSGSITNTSAYTMSSAFVDFGLTALDPFDLDIDLGGLAPGDTYGPFSIILTIPAGEYEELCIITTLHAVSDTDAHEQCCQFKTVVDVPDCMQSVSCECTPNFENLVEQGMTCNSTADDLTYTFSPVANFGECDKVIWQWIEESTANMTTGNQSITHTFPNFGEYKVCMTVIRTATNGKQCKAQICKDINVFPNGLIKTYPNPATHQLYIDIQMMEEEELAQIEVIDTEGRIIFSESSMISDSSNPAIDVADLHTGTYTLRITMGDKVTIKRFLVVH